MRKSLAAIFVLAAMPAFGHRLDEYLQGTIISVGKNRLDAQMILTPGVAVFPALLAEIDANADGAISEAEQRAYASKVLGDLTLTLDGHGVKPRLLSMQFPTIDEMKEGRGEIQLEFDADLPRGGRNRRLILENHHQSRIAAYQVNCLVSRDLDIRIVAQNRNYSQSHYELSYVQSGGLTAPIGFPWPGAGRWLGTGGLLLSAWLALLWLHRGSIAAPRL